MSVTVTVLACRRANLASEHLPANVRLVEVPCTGRATAALLLGFIARGDDGVLVLGRHQETCRLRGAEDPARDRARRVDQALALAGCGEGRVRFAVPSAGPAGPSSAVKAFFDEISREATHTRPDRPPPQLPGREGLDTALALLGWLGGGRPAQTWLEDHGLSPAHPGGPALLSGPLPHVELLGADLLRPLRVPDLLHGALETLARLGVSAGLLVGGLPGAGPSTLEPLREAAALYALSAEEGRLLAGASLRATSLDELLRERGRELPRPPVEAPVACDGSPLEAALIEALGYRPVDVGPDELPERFALSPGERAAAEARLVRAERAAAPALLVRGSLPLARWALLSRQGAWRESRVLPVMPHQLAQLSLRRVALSLRALAGPPVPRPLAPRGSTAEVAP
jgi:coenzyme F420-reducing hydrogenase delta subunit